MYLVHPTEPPFANHLPDFFFWTLAATRRCDSKRTQPVLRLQNKFIKYIDFAKSIMNSLPEEKVPVDLLDTHLFVKSCDMLEGYSHRVDEEYLREATETLESCNISKVR